MMIQKFLDWVRNLALLALIGGPLVAGYMYWDSEQTKAVAANGETATATVESMTESTGRRGGKSYKVTATWQTQAGTARTADLQISNAFARQHIVGDTYDLDQIQVRYMANEPDGRVVVVDDLQGHLDDDALLVALGAGAGGVGLVISALFWIFGRKKKPEPEPEAAT